MQCMRKLCVNDCVTYCMYACTWHFVKILVMYIYSTWCTFIFTYWIAEKQSFIYSINQFNYYTPRKRSWGIILISPCASVYLSVCLSVRPSLSVCLSVPFCGHDIVHACFENWCMDFSEFDQSELIWTYYSPSADVHLEFSYWMDNFSLFNRLFSVFGVLSFFYNNKFITRNTCVLILETLKMWCCWTATLYLLLWFTIFWKSCDNFHSVNLSYGRGGVSGSNTPRRFNKVQW